MIGGEVAAEACARQWTTFGFPMRQNSIAAEAESTPATTAAIEAGQAESKIKRRSRSKSIRQVGGRSNSRSRDKRSSNSSIMSNISDIHSNNRNRMEAGHAFTTITPNCFD